MKHISSLILTAAAMFLFASSSFAEVPVNPHFTPMSLMPRPFAASSTFDVAGIYWLPDYLGKNISRGSEDMGGGDIGGNCEENYGMHTPSNIDSRYICSKYNYNVTSSLKCHVNCRCKDEYQYTSSNCSGNYTTAGTSCEDKYNQCVCKAEFQYNSSNCSGEYEVSGTSCGGNYNACVCKSEFKYNSSNCSGSYTPSGTSCGGNYNACTCKSEFQYNSSNCSGEYEVSGTSCGGYYNACTIRPDCAVTSKDCDYGCASINSCGKCTECKSNPDCEVSSKSCDYGCASYNSCSKCTSCKEKVYVPKPGDILYSDGTITENVIAGKTPVGIVAYVNGNHGFAVALTESSQTWGGYGNDISCLEHMENRDAASADMDGYDNTRCLLNISPYYPAASYCNKFSAVSSGTGSRGWYLPAAGELYAIGQKCNAINSGLQKLSEAQILSGRYWSSSRNSRYDYDHSAWTIDLPNGSLGTYIREQPSRVRCVVAF